MQSMHDNLRREAGLVVVAQWQTKPGEGERVAGILGRFLPQVQKEPGTKLFLIARGKDDPCTFLFYELFADEASFAAHQESNYFKTLIAGEALPLLANRQRTQYQLL
jgi:quinol monooxygenase YgiN